jgi:hypothetical protein
MGVDFRCFGHKALLDVANRTHRIRNSEYKVFLKDILAKAPLFEPIDFVSILRYNASKERTIAIEPAQAKNNLR